MESKLTIENIDKQLSNPNFLFLGGQNPSYLDREACEAVRGMVIDPKEYGHTFSWYNLVS